MKKNHCAMVSIFSRVWKRKMLFIMQLTLSICLLCVLQSFAIGTYSQSLRLSINQKNISVESALQLIENKTDYYFMYSALVVDVKRTVDIEATNKLVPEILDDIFKGTNTSYKINGRLIALSENGETSPANQSIKSISGKVTDTNGSSLPGVSVVVKGTTIGVITDSNGTYSLSNIPENALLQFSFVGMKAQEIIVGSKTSINVTLDEETLGIEEVVAIGYGVQKKKLTTGATNRVESVSIEKLNSGNPLKAMQSLTSGINITKEGGSPGSDYKIFIRGIGTIGNTNPLYVVDGVTVSSINNISPADIEAIDVLKDAASSSIYGSRAANGVILVTTKKGKAGKATISYDGYYGIQNMQHKIEMLNAQDFLTIATEAGKDPNTFPTQVYNYDEIKSGAWKGTNWLNEFENKNAPVQSHSINITGGTEQSIYSIGISYLSENGILGKPNTPSHERYTFRVNSEHKLIKNNNLDILKIGENVIYNNIQRNTLFEGVGLRGIVQGIPFMPVFNADGTFYVNNNNPWDNRDSNQIASLTYQSGENLTQTSGLIASGYLLFQPLKGLVLRSSFGIDANTSSFRAFYPKYNLSTISIKSLNTVNQTMSNARKWIFENTLTYDLSIKGKHNLNLLAGMSAEKAGIGETINGSNFSPQFEGIDYAYLSNSLTIDATKGTQLLGYPFSSGRLISYFGRVSYDYKQTYLATAVIRADGSSNFAPGNRWGYFPSISAGWVMTNETFMKSASSWLNFLKFRVNWGQNGNQAIEPFQYLAAIANDPKYSNAFIGADKTKFAIGYFPSILPNPGVKWEISEQTDIGFDTRFLKGRLSLTFDWYSKLTKDWLLKAPILDSYGTGASFINGGDIQNKGTEFALSWNDKSRSGFRYGLNLNISFNKNSVNRINNPEGIIHGPDRSLTFNPMDEAYRAQVGYPIGYFWGLTNIGVFQNNDEINNYKNPQGKVIQPNAVPGDLKRKDWNDDGVIDDKDKTMIGDPNPDAVFSFSYNMEFKGFDFSINTNGVLGNQIAWSYFNGIDLMSNSMTSKMNRWHGEGTSNTEPRSAISSSNETKFSDRYISDGDYLRISNLTLGYDFKRLWKNAPLQQIHLYFTVQNLYTLTGYKGFDPEIGSGGFRVDNKTNWAGGMDLASYPLPRTFMVGLTIKY